MGYSCSAAAHETLRTLDVVCLSQTGTSNSYIGRDGHEYFYETSRVEHADGAITGSVFQMIEGFAHSSGNFRIAGDGKVTRWPTAFQRDLVQVAA